MVKPRVYVGGLPHDVSERDLEKFFKGFGRLREVLIKNGYGFVEFDDQRDADDAVYELDGEKLLGQRVTVQRARGIPRGRDRDQRDTRGGGARSSNSYRGNGRNDRFGPPTRTKYRVTVENLSSRVSWQDLKDFMRKAGEVTYADAHKEHQNQGVVEFSSYSEMKNAIKKLDDTELNGRRIRIVEDRDGAGSRSRSRSRSFRSRSISRSRSRSRKLASRSKSRSLARKSASRSPVRKSRSRSPVHMSRSRSRSRSTARKSRSRDYSRSKSRDLEKSQRSPSRSRSRSVRSKRSNTRSRSRSN